MSKNKKAKVIGALAVALVLSTAVGVGMTHAATTEPGGRMGSLVSAISQKFGVKPADVQSVLDEQRLAMEATREKEFADHLKQKVTDGTLTQAQADMITAKRAELEAWSKANNSPLQELIGMGGRPFHGHGMMK